jgi:hypothetical protein
LRIKNGYNDFFFGVGLWTLGFGLWALDIGLWTIDNLERKVVYFMFLDWGMNGVIFLENRENKILVKKKITV